VIDGVTGYSFETGSTQALTAAMEAIIQLNSCRRDLAEACLRTIAIYTPEAAARRILDGCNRILGAQ
jgi:glycosyltransferase involved in cell wall biosynthesis